MAESRDDVIRDLEDKLRDLSSRLDLSDERIRSDIREIRADVERLKTTEPNLVTIDRFRPVERLVLGGAGLLLIAVVTALASIVIRGSGQ